MSKSEKVFVSVEANEGSQKPARCTGGLGYAGMASKIVNELISVSKLMGAKNLHRDPLTWLRVMANVMGSCPACVVKTKNRYGNVYNKAWTSLNRRDLKRNMINAGINVTDEQVSTAVSEGLKWFETGGGRMRPETIGRKIMLTQEVRKFAKAFHIMPIDVTRDELKAINLGERRKREAARRVANGATPRSQSLAQTKPWEALGMGRTKWFKLGKPLPNNPAANVDDNCTKGLKLARADDFVPHNMTSSYDVSGRKTVRGKQSVPHRSHKQTDAKSKTKPKSGGMRVSSSWSISTTVTTQALVRSGLDPRLSQSRLFGPATYHSPAAGLVEDRLFEKAVAVPEICDTRQSWRVTQIVGFDSAEPDSSDLAGIADPQSPETSQPRQIQSHNDNLETSPTAKPNSSRPQAERRHVDEIGRRPSLSLLDGAEPPEKLFGVGASDSRERSSGGVPVRTGALLISGATSFGSVVSPLRANHLGCPEIVSGSSGR